MKKNTLKQRVRQGITSTFTLLPSLGRQLKLSLIGPALFSSVLMVALTSGPAHATNELNATVDTLEFKRCTVTVEAYEMDAQCATLQRHENPNDKNSRLIDLSVIKLLSHSPEPEPDAFTIIQGGPGGSSIDMAMSYSSAFNEIRKKRDLIILDQRGTGRSNLLTCDAPPEEESGFDLALVRQQTKKCVNKLSENNDLRFYTTSIAVDDLEAMRAAAGYTQLNIYGVSYGTRVAQHYLRKYPANTRSVVLDGVTPIGLNLAGGEIARRWEDGFEQLTQRCLESDACKATHGNLRRIFIELQQRFETQSLSVTVPHPLTAQPTNYTFTEDSLLVALRLMLYSTEQRALIPILLSEAQHGNYAFVAAQIIQAKEIFTGQFATGMHNSVVCAEDAPFVTEEDVAQADGTLIGRKMSQAMKVTCDHWPKGPVDEDFFTPFESEVPVLVLSGATDPVTPPENGDMAANMLGNTKHVVVPAHGHGVAARGCASTLVSNFVHNTSLTDIDARCVERERAMPFFSTLTGPRP